MEITANAIQTVATNENVLFTDTIITGSCSILHRRGSGLVTLRGLGQQMRARYRVWFNANVALAADATVAPITLALSIGGETIPATQMIATPAAIGDYANVSASTFIEVFVGNGQTISVHNVGTQPVDVQNANLIVERVA